MNLSVFTVEEENLICVFDVTARTELINDINNAMPYFDGVEMREIAQNVLKKLDVMTDTEFTQIDFSPAYSDDETEV